MAQKRSIAEMSPVMSLLPGPLAALFDDAEVTGIMVDGPERISVERQGKVQDTSLRFDSNDEIKAAIRGLLKAAGVQIDEGRSVCEAQLGDHSRLLAVLSPAAINGHSLIIRKWSANPVTWEKLLEYRALTPPVRDLIQSALNAHVNILVAGGSASGKITMTNRIVELIPPDERVVSVEQTHEFQFNHPRAVFLEAGAAAHVSMDDLLMAGSRMRPDWLVVGELAGAEAARCIQRRAQRHHGPACRQPGKRAGAPGSHVPDGPPGAGAGGHPRDDRFRPAPGALPGVSGFDRQPQGHAHFRTARHDQRPLYAAAADAV